MNILYSLIFIVGLINTMSYGMQERSNSGSGNNRRNIERSVGRLGNRLATVLLDNNVQEGDNGSEFSSDDSDYEHVEIFGPRGVERNLMSEFNAIANQPEVDRYSNNRVNGFAFLMSLPTLRPSTVAPVAPTLNNETPDSDEE